MKSNSENIFLDSHVTLLAIWDYGNTKDVTIHDK